MADTKTKTRPEPDTTETAPSTDEPTSALGKAVQGVKDAFTGTTDTETTNDAPPEPAPAVSYAGSGTTSPTELNPTTHGTHYRGPQGDI
jgi:hypothetical protein